MEKEKDKLLSKMFDSFDQTISLSSLDSLLNQCKLVYHDFLMVKSNKVLKSSSNTDEIKVMIELEQRFQNLIISNNADQSLIASFQEKIDKYIKDFEKKVTFIENFIEMKKNKYQDLKKLLIKAIDSHIAGKQLQEIKQNFEALVKFYLDILVLQEKSNSDKLKMDLIMELVRKKKTLLKTLKEDKEEVVSLAIVFNQLLQIISSSDPNFPAEKPMMEYIRTRSDNIILFDKFIDFLNVMLSELQGVSEDSDLLIIFDILGNLNHSKLTQEQSLTLRKFVPFFKQIE